MTNAKRGRGSHRGVYFVTAAALGLALSACGGGGGGGVSPAGVASNTQSSVPAQSSQGSTSSSGTSTSGTSTSSAPPTVNSVAINWSPPTENVDGTPLTNLAGYDIHYGTAPGKYTQTVAVSNPGLATYVVQNLSPGTYYFAVAAVNAAGTESPLSSEVSATVN